MTRRTFGKNAHGETLYWPDKSYLAVKVPAPLEQFLERFAWRSPHLGQTAEEIAVHFLRAAIIERMREPGDAGWTPDPERYAKKRPRLKP